MVKVAINGFGRIGRLVYRQIFNIEGIEVVAINDLTSPKTLAHLLKYDSAQGRFDQEVSNTDSSIIVNGHEVKIYAQRDPSQIPWGEHGVDVVIESTGFFTDKEKAELHIKAGAKRVVISAPATGEMKTVVYNVNHTILDGSETVISAASCTTNCLAPLVKPLLEKIGIESGLMTTIHAFTNDQVLTDVYHKDMRRARSAVTSMIPTKTGAAKAVGLVLPALAGRFDGFAMRVPVINVSVVDLTFAASRATSVDEVNSILKAASEGELKGILGFNTLPLVSIDFNHDPRPSIYDASQTRVSADGKLVKVLAWYDNEWGYSVQMLNAAEALMAVK